MRWKARWPSPRRDSRRGRAGNSVAWLDVRRQDLPEVASPVASSVDLVLSGDDARGQHELVKPGLAGHTGRVTELGRHAPSGGREQIAETRQTYDLIASEYARRNSVAAAEVAERLDELAASVPAGRAVADIGCGPGRDVKMLRARGLHVAGFDLSLGQLQASDVPGLVQADMRRLPLRAGSVHGIWCWAALVHLPREAVPQALAEFARVVHSGGSLVMSIAEGDGAGFEVAAPYGSDRRRWFTRYREPELTALLTAAGFSIRNVRRHRAYRDWLSVHATRGPAGGPSEEAGQWFSGVMTG